MVHSSDGLHDPRARDHHGHLHANRNHRVRNRHHALNDRRYDDLPQRLHGHRNDF